MKTTRSRGSFTGPDYTGKEARSDKQVFFFTKGWGPGATGLPHEAPRLEPARSPPKEAFEFAHFSGNPGPLPPHRKQSKPGAGIPYSKISFISCSSPGANLG